MTEQVMTVIVTFIVSSSLSYALATVKKYKKRDDTEKEAIKCLLRANIVNQYYVYKKIGEIPFYVKESLHKEFEAYENLDGNSFVADVMKEIDTWRVV